MEPIRVLLVDDHHLVLEGLKMILAPQAGVAVVGTAATAADALTQARALCPDVVLLDLNLPGGNGADVCQQLRRLATPPRVVALTTHHERTHVERLLAAGAIGYVLKNARPDELVEAIGKAYAGKRYFSDEVQELLLSPPLPAVAVLTRREKEVLGLIATGLTGQAIADKLFISGTTVETHRRNLLAKLEASNTAALISVAARHGLL